MIKRKWNGKEQRNFAQLREAAEHTLADKEITKTDKLRSAEELLHALQVHQIELEMQNENLRQTQIALEESRDRYVDLYEFSPVAYLTLNDRGQIDKINLTGSGLLGVERQKLTKHRFVQLIAEDDRERWNCCFQDLLSNMGSRTGELTLRRGDGSTFLAQVDCLGQKSENGALSVRMVLSDITERKQLHLRLTELSSRLTHILENTPAIHYACRIEAGQFIPNFVSHTLFKYWGYEESECLANSKWWWSGIHPDGRDEIIAGLEEALMKPDRSNYVHEYAFRRKDGVFRWVHDEIHISRDAQGHAVEIVGSWLDITDRRLVEQQLRESEAKFRAIVEGTLDGIVLVDDSGMIVDFNPVFERQCGLPAERLRQMRIWELRPADQFELAKARFFSVLETGAGGVAEVKYRKPDGRVINIEFRSTPIWIGDRRYLQSIVRDITLHKARELELHNYQQLLRDMAAQSASTREAECKRIAREVHDELGQLLTALRMDISLMRIQFGELDPVLQDKIQDMRELVDKAIKGVRDVTSNLRPASLDMGIVPALNWLCDEFPDRTQTACSLRVINEPVGLDDARTVALFRIVQESLTNVARHAQATRVEITLAQRQQDIVLDIIDNGIGFDSSAAKGHGSFGLLGMRERALALGGTVHVNSVPAEGTRVSVQIPISETKLGRRSND